MDKEKEAYRMTSGNGAPNSSGPRFKSSSKRRIYIVIGVVCLLIVVAVAIALGVYFGVRGCKMDKVTLTVKSSDCNTYVAEVSITSSAELTITEKGPGVYVGEVCGMPATLSLRKEGFEPLTTTVTGAAVNVTLTCSEPNCTVQTASILVKSTCATSPVEDVTIKGQNVIDITSSTIGSYQTKVCSKPTLVDIERIGYAAQQTAISDGSTVTLLCDSPIIIKDPQSKYRREGESVTLCCQAQPVTEVTYKWYKDGTELIGETNNEVTLTSLGSGDQGQYQCSAKLTADPNLPAVRSREATLTIRADSDDCADAWRPKQVEVFPGCYYDVGQCLKRSCRSAGSGESCSDNNVCCETTGSVRPDCAMGKLVTKVLRCSCRCQASSFIIVKGTVKDSDTDLPLKGIIVMLVGDTVNTTSDVNGEFSFNSVPSSKRRLVAKASDSEGNYLDNYVVKTIPGSESFDQVIINIAMFRKAPILLIDPGIENKLSISGDPSALNSSPTYLKIPANVFYNTDGTQYTGQVSLSLTFIDPTENLEDAPGEFVTLNPDGIPAVLVTLGVFSIEFENNAGKQLLLSDNINVFSEGPTPYRLWQLDEQTGTWVIISSLPGRKKRQDTQERPIGSFIPQRGRLYNIDYVLREPPCFYKIRVFLGDFSEQNEVTRNLKVSPKVTQTIAIDDGNGVRYMQPEGTGCFTILCPIDLARASITLTPWFSNVNTPLRAASIEDYSSGIKSILQQNAYSYDVVANDATKLFVNTQMAETGPFYQNQTKCDSASFDEPSFWFAELPEFSKSDFYDGSVERCVGKLRITIQSVNDPDKVDEAINSKVDVISVWADKFGSKPASTYLIGNYTFSKSMFHLYIGSCFEYKCSVKNEITSVSIAFSNYTSQYCYATTINPPILSSSEIPEGYFFNEMSNVQDAIENCLSDNGDFSADMTCSP